MRRLLIAFFFLIIALGIFYIAPNYQVTTFYEENEVRIIIDDREITKEIPHPVLLVDDAIMLSTDTIDIYFDKWLYYDQKYNTYITSSDLHLAKMQVDSTSIEIDGVKKTITTPLKVIDDVVYVPIEALEEVYDINVVYNEKVIITKPNLDAQSFIVKDSDINLRALKTYWSRKTATASVGEKIDVYRYIEEKEWVWARTANGSLGYVNINDLKPYSLVNHLEQEKNEFEKVNLVWEYAENYTPNRSGQAKIDTIDIISPTWIYLKDEYGNLRNTIDENYINWAHSQGYEVWAVLKNDRMGIEKTSMVVTDMKTRETLVSQLLKLCEVYNLDGINIDFEEMKKEDADEFSQFVREISTALRRNGYKVSVDVTVPDGSDTWSLCYNRYELAEAVDYIVLMAYDQYGVSSSKAGSVATYTWVESNVKKMVERDGIDNQKIILGIPLYSRKWEIQNGKRLSSSVVTMKYLEKYIDSKNTHWLENEKQYYYENINGNKSTIMWMDEKESIIQKLSLIEEYDLAGSAYWMWGYEYDGFWDDISDYIKY